MNRQTIALAIVAFALGNWGLLQMWQTGQAEDRADAMRVYAKLLLDAGLEGCLERDAIVAASAQNMWEARDATVGGASALVVMLPGAGEDGLRLDFDEKGCLSRHPGPAG